MTGPVRALTCCLLTAALAASAAGVAGCAEGEKPVTLPSLTPRTATPTSTAGMTDEEQIRWIYAGYARGLHEAERIPDEEKRRQYLSQWLTEPALTDRVEGAAEFRKAGYRTKGTPIPHVTQTEITGQTAKVHACTDEGPLITTNTETGERSQGAGVRQVFDLKRTVDGWRIYAVLVGNDICEPNDY